MRVVVIDHEDSFSYNLVQGLAEAGAEVRCLRYTEPWTAVARQRPGAIVLSPGPGHPSDRRVTRTARAVLRRLSGRIPTLGVCLGHQIIGDAFGARIVRGRPVHGETTPVRHAPDPIFDGMPNPFAAARYHSLRVARHPMPPALRPIAWAPDGSLMAVRHANAPIVGVQFHPESFLTEGGPRMLRNFLAEAAR
ncbi:MAG: aminodeoxychorismate/anthranilate synthase component II [Thermoplasmata archaeon]